MTHSKKINLEEVDIALFRSLYIILSSAYIHEGHVLETKKLVGKIRGFEVYIYPDEHAPPHFHVIKGSDINVSFSISDCTRLQGDCSRNEEKIIKYWHQTRKEQLIKAWNKTRPDTCQVGLYRDS